MSLDAKYPRTPYWPFSPSIGRGDGVHPDPGRFVGETVVVTEKLDGGNTLLHGGKVYARSMSAPSEGKWMAMVKKHHAWKVNEPDVYLYGEDIYGVHSIEYGPVPEQATYYAFAPPGRASGIRVLFGARSVREPEADSGGAGPVQGQLPVGLRDTDVRGGCPCGALGTWRRTGGGRAAGGARFRNRRVFG